MLDYQVHVLYHLLRDIDCGYDALVSKHLRPLTKVDRTVDEHFKKVLLDLWILLGQDYSVLFWVDLMLLLRLSVEHWVKVLMRPLVTSGNAKLLELREVLLDRLS